MLAFLWGWWLRKHKTSGLSFCAIDKYIGSILLGFTDSIRFNKIAPTKSSNLRCIVTVNQVQPPVFLYAGSLCSPICCNDWWYI